MENASKALIIAGSVLIAILLISLGLLIFKSTQGATDQTQDLGKTLEVQQFNSQFLKYCGDSVKGSQVRTLCEVIIAHNANSDNKVSININNSTTNDPDAISNHRANIITSKNYEVKAKYSNGLINEIEVKQNS